MIIIPDCTLTGRFNCSESPSGHLTKKAQWQDIIEEYIMDFRHHIRCDFWTQLRKIKMVHNLRPRLNFLGRGWRCIQMQCMGEFIVVLKLIVVWRASSSHPQDRLVQPSSSHPRDWLAQKLQALDFMKRPVRIGCTASKGYNEVRQSFHLLMHHGSTLNQIRMKSGWRIILDCDPALFVSSFLCCTAFFAHFDFEPKRLVHLK